MALLTLIAVAEKTTRSRSPYPGRVTATIEQNVLDFPHLKRELPFQRLRRAEAPGHRILGTPLLGTASFVGDNLILQEETQTTLQSPLFSALKPESQ